MWDAALGGSPAAICRYCKGDRQQDAPRSPRPFGLRPGRPSVSLPSLTISTYGLRRAPNIRSVLATTHHAPIYEIGSGHRDGQVDCQNALGRTEQAPAVSTGPGQRLSVRFMVVTGPTPTFKVTCRHLLFFTRAFQSPHGRSMTPSFVLAAFAASASLRKVIVPSRKASDCRRALTSA